ncbi:DMT family transporter [Ottowia thiooxydans]|uniref:DMT family transporter n=1 Tax=Ottowia thiooxydans TaxID=219182 RepID=UPI0004126794|nr:multidrug efflux SMR transporter [Ottowia thiooxydans]
MQRSWIFLSAAITSEVAGLTVMKIASESDSLFALLFMYTLIGLSFCFFSVAVRRLPLALAYATWETLGLLSITAIGFQFFGEHLTPQRLLGVSALIAGVLMLNFSPAPSDTEGTDSGAPKLEG